MNLRKVEKEVSKLKDRPEEINHNTKEKWDENYKKGG